MMLVCLLSCKKEKKIPQNNASEKTEYKTKENPYSEQGNLDKKSIKVIEKIPDSLQSFVGSCGTECAIIYHTRKIEILDQKTIAVHFDTEQIIQDETESNSTDDLIFKYNEGGNLNFVTDAKNRDVLVELPYSLSERMLDFGSRMFFVLCPEKRNKIFSKTLKYKGIAEVSEQFSSFTDENGEELTIKLNKNQQLTKEDIGKIFKCQYQYRKAISLADSETEYLQAFMLKIKKN